MNRFEKLNKLLRNPNHWFTPDTIQHGNNTILFTTVYNDMNVIPTKWYENGLACKKDVQNEASWLNKNVFQLMIDNLIWKNKTDSSTELVKLRIFVNKIQKSESLTDDDKLDWENWVKDLYWTRKTAVFDYYLDDIIGLPF